MQQSRENTEKKTLKAEPAEESVMQLLLQAKQSLPKQKNSEVQERVNRAVDNIIRNFGAVRMSTGMTPEEAVRLAAKTAGGKDSDVFVPPASGIVYKSSTGRDSGGDRRIFSDIKLSEFIAKAKNRPAMTKEVELERMIQRIRKIQESDTRKDGQNLKEIENESLTPGKTGIAHEDYHSGKSGIVSTAIGALKYLPNLLNRAEREAWYRTDEFEATALTIGEVEKLAAMEEENYASMKPTVPSETRSYSIERELDEKYGYILSADVSHESPVMARIVPATRSRSGQETARKLEVEHTSSSSKPAKYQSADSSGSEEGLKFRAASTDASGRISRQISAAVWSDRLLQGKYGKKTPAPVVNSINVFAGESSGAVENKASYAIPLGNSRAQNVTNSQPEQSLKGDAIGHGGVESVNDGFTAGSAARNPSSEQTKQKNFGKVNKNIPDASLNHAGAVAAPEQEEAARLERMNANYEHDRAILAKTDPAFARNQFRDVGHADGSGEEFTRRDIEDIASKEAIRRFNNINESNI